MVMTAASSATNITTFFRKNDEALRIINCLVIAISFLKCSALYHSTFFCIFNPLHQKTALRAETDIEITPDVSDYSLLIVRGYSFRRWVPSVVNLAFCGFDFAFFDKI